MSRSRRRTPIVAMTTAESDKRFKVREHQRERSTVRRALAMGRELPDPRAFGDPCLSDKDGKHYWPDPKAYRK